MYLTEKELLEMREKNILLEATKFKSRKLRDSYDIFLSYSNYNRAFAIDVVQLLEKNEFTVYIDLLDDRLDRDSVSKETAKILFEEMDKSKALVYISSPNASVSKWCPWEIGYFSGKKNFKCATLPLVKEIDSEYKGQEYLGLYNRLVYNNAQDSEDKYFYIRDENNYSGTLRKWIDDQWDVSKLNKMTY